VIGTISVVVLSI